MKRMALVGLGLLAACSGPRLDTRTFELQHLRGEEARDIIRPYVFDDRPDAPGMISTQGQLMTVRETPDNLEKIARVLASFDRPAPGVRLHFQIIQADGVTGVDPAIADVEAELRKWFRFRGYRLAAEAVTGGTEGTEISQVVAGLGHTYVIRGSIWNVYGTADSGSVRLTAYLGGSGATELKTTVTLRSGQTAVLGNTQQGEKGTLILTVRPELVK